MVDTLIPVGQIAIWLQIYKLVPLTVLNIVFLFLPPPTVSIGTYLVAGFVGDEVKKF
jgi:hypothetical protein